jgi:hypothetical protein
VDRNLKVIVRRGKDVNVSTIKKETSSTLTNVTKYDDIIQLNLEISQLLKKIGDVLGLNSRIIHIFAKKYADNLKEEIAKISKKRAILHNALNSHEDLRIRYKTLEDSSKKISNLKSEFSQKNQRILEINAEIDSIRNTITKLEKEIIDLKAMKEYGKFFEIKKRIKLLSSERLDIKNKIDQQFSKISRPLGKYSYISAFEKPVKKIMENLIIEPYDVILPQNKTSIIEILRAVSKSVISGGVSVKDTQKSLEQVEETITQLDEFLKLKELHSSKVAFLEDGLLIFDIKSFELKEHDFLKEKTDLMNLEVIKNSLEAEISEGNRLLGKLASEIETGINSFSSKKFTLKI